MTNHHYHKNEIFMRITGPCQHSPTASSAMLASLSTHDLSARDLSARDLSAKDHAGVNGSRAQYKSVLPPSVEPKLGSFLVPPASSSSGFITSDHAEKREYLRKFWSGIYASSASESPYLPLREDLASIMGNTPLTGYDMSFLFAKVCGLGPLFNLDPKTGRVIFTDKRVSADFRLFDSCNLPMLEKMSAWHWIQMYDDGLVEPTSNPSVLLSCLGLNDRMQYLREMTSTRSVPWLEQARWFTVDSMKESHHQGLKGISTVCVDMMFLLQLLESTSRGKEPDDTYLTKRLLVISLVLYFLGWISGEEGWVQFRMLYNFVSHGLSAIRCHCLYPGKHIAQLRDLNRQLLDHKATEAG